MQQVKIFKSVEAEISALEADVNKWIRDSGAKVISVTGNIAPQTGQISGSGSTGKYAPSDIFLVLVYETDKPTGGK